MKKLAAALVTAISTALATAAAPVIVAPPAHADACADVHGRHVAAGGCTDPDRWGGWALPAYAITVPPPNAPPPCYTPSGEPYWTPPGEPCY
jgi:hypothetical protein